MSCSYVCRTCRRDLLQRLWRQRSSRATFISLSAKEPPAAESLSHNGKHRPRDEQTRPIIDPSGAQGPASDPSYDWERLLALPFGKSDGNVQGRYSGRKEEPIIVDAQDNPNLIRKYKVKDEITELSEALANPKASAVKAWTVFTTRFCGLSRSKNRHEVHEIEDEDRKVLHRLFLAVVASWCTGEEKDSLPRPSELVTRFQDLKFMDVDLWHKMQVPMLIHLVKLQRLKELPEGNGQDVMSELLRVWQGFFRQFSGAESDGVTETEPERWNVLPKPAELKGIKGPKKFADRFFQFASNFPRLRSRDTTLTANVLSTFALVLNRNIRPEKASTGSLEAEPFITFIAQLLVWSELRSDPKPMKPVLDVLFPQEDSTYLFELLSESMSKTMTIVAAIPDKVTESSPNDKADIRPVDQRTLLSDLYVKRLGRALEHQDVARAQEFWREAHRDFAHLGMDANLFRQFLRTFMALRQPNVAIDVWNTMISTGVEPDVAAWTAMMVGCAEAKEAEALDSIWQKMLASGVKPDVGAWTARIHGLMSCRKWDMGLRAFEEMARAWLSAAKLTKTRQTGKSKANNFNLGSNHNLGDAVKPTTATLNALITGLARGRRHDSIARVLSWAQSHGIKGNAATYNGLIISAFRQGNADKAAQLLREMDAAGIQPDIVTFTVVLDSLFRTSPVAGLSKEEQQVAVSKFLAEMESKGLKPNAYLYSTLIDRLLKQQNNVLAARAILDHMHARGTAPEATIYTILITHYFQQQPPDFAAIDALWHRIPEEQGSVDMIFYDRMIEGYARYGEIGKMMTFLTRMSKERKPPGWWALSSAIKALANAGDFGRIAEIVRDVHREEGLFKDGCRGRTGKQDFWALVNDLSRSPQKQEIALSV